ncbi:OmpH/Skp family outer membrane protein [Arenibacterium sp. CAU 1754]
MAHRFIRRLTALALSLWAAVGSAGLVSVANAQELGLPQSAILTISSDRLFSGSDYGRRVAAEIEADGAILSAENRKIEAELTAEEHELTTKREQMGPDEFRALADAFDEKVQEIRRTQDTKARTLSQRGEEARVAFYQAARPVLAALMREAGAGVILERSSVFLSANATDITDIAISRINAAIGDGTQTAPEPSE